MAASLLAAAADKTGSINLDMVIYINFIYGVNQAGGLVGAEGRTYFDFSRDPDGAAFQYGRDEVYGSRGSVECGVDEYGNLVGLVQVLQPELDADGNEVSNHFVTTCMDLLGYDPETSPDYNAVRFWDMVETYEMATDAEGNPITGYDFVDNVRAFAQAADDALQVIEYIHNYKVPEVLYP